MYNSLPHQRRPIPFHQQNPIMRLRSGKDLPAPFHHSRISKKRRLHATPAVKKEDSGNSVISTELNATTAAGHPLLDDLGDDNILGRGGYGTVYKSTADKATGSIVAVKKLHRGLCLRGRREIDHLMRLKGHPSVVEFKKVITNERDGDHYVVMEYMKTDLHNYIHCDGTGPFDLSEIKSLMKQLLVGLKFIHETGIMHRDIKPSNILLGENGELKICDFGMSRAIEESGPYSPKVGSQSYQAPEMLLGADDYSSTVDMWGAGCIMAELFLKKPLFRSTRGPQIDEIFRVLGTPDEEVWPGLSALLEAEEMDTNLKQHVNVIKSTFRGVNPVTTRLGLDLLSKFLTYDPKKRITAADALHHGWFNENV